MTIFRRVHSSAVLSVNILHSSQDKEQAMASAPTSNAEYLKLQETQDNTGEQIRLVPTLITEYQCMIIGSYGDQYASQIKDRVVPKESSKPGGKFLRGVTDDLEIVQEMIMNDSRKHLAYVLPDVPGAQRTCSHYISKIEVFLKTCQKSGGNYICNPL